MAIIDPVSASLDQLVCLGKDFMASIDLEKADDPAYRAKCSKTYIYLSEDEIFFTGVVKALRNLLPNGRRVVLEIGPYGVGKSLLDVVRGDLFATPNNRAVLDKLPKGFWKEQIEELTHDTGALVIYIGGTHPLTQSNLDNAFITSLEKALPPGIQISSQFDHANKWIASTKPSGENNFLRARFERHLNQLSTDGRSWTMGELEEGLKRRIPSALDIFRQALDATMSWPGAIFGASTAAEVYEEIRTTLVGANRLFSNILIFFDEFSQWANIASPKDISTLQSFVEWVNRSQHVAMVISSQIRPERYGDGHNELETLISRTYSIALDRTSYAGLLRGAIERRIKSYPPVDSRRDWSRLASLHKELFPQDNEPDRMVRGYYPFHPATVRALPALADQLGYRERSIAQYLSMGKDVPGFGQFIQGPLFEDDRGDLRLITLDRLFAYFEARLRDDKPPIYSRYEQAMATVTDKLSRRLLKTLALCDVLEARAPLMPTEENIVRLLNLPPEDTDSLVDMQRRLQDLIDNGFVYVDGQGHYKLSASGGLSLPTVNKAVAQRKQAIASSGVPIGAAEAIPAIENAVKTALSLRNHNFQSPQAKDLPFSNDASGERKQIKSVAYQNRFKVDHEFTAQLVSRRLLQEWQRKVSLDRRNAQYETILVVIATDTDSQQNDFDQMRQNARILAQAGMTVGIPKAPFILTDAIREVKAAEQVAGDELYRNSQFAERALWDHQSRLLSQLIKEVRVDAFEWYTPDLAAGDQPVSAKSLVGIADKTAMHLGRGFPFGITGDNLVGTRLNNEVITSLLQAREIQLTRNRQKPQKDRIIRDALAPIGLINIANGGVTAPTDEAEVIRPDSTNHADTRAIWDLLDNALGTGGSSQTIANVVNSLSHEPYWLPRDFGIYVLSAFVGFYELRVYKVGLNIPCTAEILKKLWEDPTGYTLKPAPRTSLSPEARLLLDDLQVVLIDVLPQAKLKRIELKNATSLSEDQLTVLSSNIHTWDTKVGIKAREIAILCDLTLPFPLKEWLAFLEEIEGGQLDHDQGETYTINLTKRIINDPTAAKVLAGSLDQQVRQLQKLVDEAPMLNRAAAAIQKPAATAQLETAWNAFRADPLNEIRRRELQTALTVVNIDAEPISTPKGLSEEKTGTTIHDGSKIDYGAGPSGVPPSTSTRNNIQADDLAKPINTSTLPEMETDKRHIDDWQAAVNTIAKEEINADALQRCISLMQQLVVQIKESGTMPSGEFVLTQVVTALKPLED